MQLEARTIQTRPLEALASQRTPKRTPPTHQQTESLFDMNMTGELVNVENVLPPVLWHPTRPGDSHQLTRGIGLIPHNAIVLLHHPRSHGVVGVHQHPPQRGHPKAVELWTDPGLRQLVQANSQLPVHIACTLKEQNRSPGVVVRDTEHVARQRLLLPLWCAVGGPQNVVKWRAPALLEAYGRRPLPQRVLKRRSNSSSGAALTASTTSHKQVYSVHARTPKVAHSQSSALPRVVQRHRRRQLCYMPAGRQVGL